MRWTYIKNIFVFAKNAHSSVIRKTIYVHAVRLTSRTITQERNNNGNTTKLTRKALIKL